MWAEVGSQPEVIVVGVSTVFVCEDVVGPWKLPSSLLA